MQKIATDLFIKKQFKRCQKCQSLFITDSGCESCGFQFHVDVIGPPMGKRSFFFLRESYHNNAGIIFRLFGFFERKKSANCRHFKRSLIHRLNLLVEYFEDVSNRQTKQASLYYIELKFIINELIAYDIDPLLIENRLTSLENYPLFYGLFDIIARGIKKEQSKLKSIFSYRIVGDIPLARFCFYCLSTICIVMASIFFYPMITKIIAN